MENIYLKLSGNVLLFLLALIALIGLSVFVYRRTIPPVPTWFRRILIALRILALIIILFILFEPIISLSWNRIEQPIIAVLMDTSASMSLTDNEEVRSDKAQAVVESGVFRTASKDKEIEYYQFSGNLAPLDINKLDSVKFDRDGTDLSTALKSLKEKSIDRYLRGVVLITDGINNLGENPARYVEDFDTPIFPVAIGRAIEQKDVVISKVISNQITYANNKVPVDVSLKSHGYSNQKIEVQLLKDGKMLDSKNVEVNKELSETKVRLEFTPKEPGFQKYQIQVPVLEGELTAINNQKNFYTKVLKSKMSILFIAGSPDPDFKFIKKNLEGDQNIEVDYWVVKKDRQFYQGNFPTDPSRLELYDCIILQNFPVRNTFPNVIRSVQNVLESNSKPLLFIAGNGINYQSLLSIKNFLPFQLPLFASNEMLVVPRLTAQGLIHPVTRIVDNEFENQQKWREMAPIYLSFNRIQLYPGSETLIEIDPEQTLLRGLREPLPIVVSMKMGQQKSVAILGYGIWRWDLLMWGIGKSNEVFKQFLSNTIRWLITKEDSKLVRIYPDHEIYRNGQPVTFTAEVYYEDYRPMDGAEVKLKVISKQKTYEILLNGIGEGKYEGAIQTLEGGDYSFEGIATYNTREIGRDSGQFSVENFNLEFLQTKMDENLLKQIALKTGGKFLTDSNFSSLDTLLQFPDRKTLVSTEMQLWNKLILLIAAILLLSAEWFLRKRSGML